MDEYLTKPLDSRRLCQVVEDLADDREPAADTDGPIDDAFNTLLARVGGDRDLLAEISRLFLEDAPRHLDRIDRAIRALDAEALRRAAHGLKGAAANFDAAAVVAAARELEDLGRSADLANASDCATASRTVRQLHIEVDRLLDRLRGLAT